MPELLLECSRQLHEIVVVVVVIILVVVAAVA